MKPFQIAHRLRAVTVAAALAITGIAAHAERGGHGDHHRGGGSAMMASDGLFAGHIEHMLDVANATDAQRSQIDSLFKAAREELAGQHDASSKLHVQLAALYTATNIDAAAIESVRAQMSAQREVASKRLSQASIDAARVLTPEQRARIGEVMKKRMARMPSRHTS